jgi:hypothetical protein
VDVHASLQAPCRPDDLFAFVDDLGAYPAWTDLVRSAERLPGDVDAWQVELRAHVGPLARSKRLRMVRSARDPVGRTVTFERAELDGRRHAPWVLHAVVTAGDGSELNVHLHYGGRLWSGGVLERVLADSITDGRQRLLELVSPTH